MSVDMARVGRTRSPTDSGGGEVALHSVGASGDENKALVAIEAELAEGGAL